MSELHNLNMFPRTAGKKKKTRYPVVKHAFSRFRYRGNILHTRNQHLGNHRGFPVAFSNGSSVAFSNTVSLVSCILHRIVSFPVDFHWNCPMNCQWHVPALVHLCDFRRVVFRPDNIMYNMMYTCVYIYILYRERERKNNKIYVYIYIYTYIDI